MILNDLDAELKVREYKAIEKEKEEQNRKIEEMIEYYNNKKIENEEKYNAKLEEIESDLIYYASEIKKEELKETKTQKKLKLATFDLIIKKPGYKIIAPKTSEKNILLEKYPEFKKIKEEFDYENFKKTLAIVENKVVLSETGEIVEEMKIEEEKSKLKIK